MAKQGQVARWHTLVYISHAHAEPCAQTHARAYGPWACESRVASAERRPVRDEVKKKTHEHDSREHLGAIGGVIGVMG